MIWQNGACRYAQILEEQLILLEKQLKTITETVDEKARENELTPYVTNRYGPIAGYSFCHPIQGVVLEGVWAINRCGYGGPLAAKFRSLADRMNKRKSAVAIARKPVTPAWLLMKRRGC